MAESVVLVTQTRDTRGSQAARRLRRKGQVPAVVYGHQEATVSIALAVHDLVEAIRHGTRVVDLQMGSAKQKALISEIQWDHLGKEILHADFERVDADERIKVQVPIEIRGTAPGIAAGGLLDQPIHVLSIECLAVAIPQSIRVNVGELQLGQAIHIKDLHLPEGVKALGDADAIVVHVTEKQAEPEPGAAPAAAQAEPEVIGRQKAAEEEAE
jgi:large subunit ribosomal protein L25